MRLGKTSVLKAFQGPYQNTKMCLDIDKTIIYNYSAQQGSGELLWSRTVSVIGIGTFQYCMSVRNLLRISGFRQGNRGIYSSRQENSTVFNACHILQDKANKRLMPVIMVMDNKKFYQFDPLLSHLLLICYSGCQTFRPYVTSASRRFGTLPSRPSDVSAHRLAVRPL